MNRVLLFLFAFVIYSANGNPLAPADKEQPVTYIQFLLSQPISDESYPLDCSNISDFIHSYLEMSETHQALLAISAERFKTEVLSGEKTQEEKEAIKKDITRTLYLMEESGMVLLNQSQLIKATMPECLKK